MKRAGYLTRRLIRKATVGIIIIVILLLLGDKLVKYVATTLYPQKYGEYISKYSSEFSVDEAFCFALVKCESGFNKDATSHAGAIGLMQLTPETFKWVCDRIYHFDVDENLIYDPATNLKCGIYYLSYLKTEFGDERTVIAAYNAGPNLVKEWLQNKKYSSDGKTLEKTPYAETENHIEKVQKAKKIYKELYNLK